MKKKKLDPDPQGDPRLYPQSNVRVPSYLHRENRNLKNETFFCGEVVILDCTFSISDALDRLDLKNI